MIKGLHAMFYTDEPEELRAFLRDKLELRWTDVGGGWLIFEVPEAEIGCHPVVSEKSKPAGTHDISFYCENLDETIGKLKERGVEFIDEVKEEDYGRIIHFTMPGGVTVQLYEPQYETGF
jgi:predicted enzyme related to lactoylglutathione lyase